MPKVFSRQTLGVFEDASASIPLRPLDRAFDGAGIRLGEDPGGDPGARKTQFRRYVASVDQHDPQQLARLGAALGALIEEVATSKQEFLVRAAERDGFIFADGTFRAVRTAPSSFAVASAGDLASIDERVRRLALLANESPKDAIGGAKELVESVCRTVLSLRNEPAPAKAAGLSEISESTLASLGLFPPGADDTKADAALIGGCLQQLSAVLETVAELKDARATSRGRNGTSKAPSPRLARLAVGVAATFAGFVAESYAEQATSAAVSKVLE